MRCSVSAVLAAGALFASGTAHAQTRALVLQDLDPFLGLPQLTDELAAQGIPYDKRTSGAFPTVNLFQYTMIFVASCQSNTVYNAWNGRAADLDTFVSAGGFVGIHGNVWACGAGTGATFPQPPGGNITWTPAPSTSGTNASPADPVMLGVPLAPTGTPFFAFGFMGGLQGTDTVLATIPAGTASFRRQVGAGTVVVSTAQLESAYSNNGDAAQMLINEVALGDAIGQSCSNPDADGDGICDLADRCPGSDDLADADSDGTPDGCDACPFAATDDSDNDGVCDDLDLCLPGDDNLDLDGDAFPDPCDNCLGLANPFQEDQDQDGAGDACDVCPRDADDDADADGVCGDADVCPGFDDGLDGDSDGVPDDCDNCPANANLDQFDSDFDGIGDACDLCFDTGAPLDGDGDGWRNSCDNCPFDPNPGQEDADADGVGDLCDNCTAAANTDQFDWDFDGMGDACDLCVYGNNEIDTDDDGVPDDCDPCPLDAADDSDGDGVCDSDDLCPGTDDALDSDQDTIPDACDNCPGEYNRPQNDRDGDGFGSACDCDDRNPDAFPGGVEVCDFADNDCNGHADDVGGVSNVFWPDSDGDSWGDATGVPIESCEQPLGYTVTFGDCDDADPERNPDAIEYCDKVDNDCDTVVDGARCRPRSQVDCGCDTGTGAPGGWIVLAGLVIAGLRRRDAR